MRVNAFQFEHMWKDKMFHPAQYPEIAKQAINAGDEVLNWEILTDTSVAKDGSPAERLESIYV